VPRALTAGLAGAGGRYELTLTRTSGAGPERRAVGTFRLAPVGGDTAWDSPDAAGAPGRVRALLIGALRIRLADAGVRLVGPEPDTALAIASLERRVPDSLSTGRAVFAVLLADRGAPAPGVVVFDADGVEMYVHEAGAEGFRGRWRRSYGGDSGYFCARRERRP
jgi:hypothetical protein